MIAAAKPNLFETKPYPGNKAVWTGLMILGFIVWWPLGLALLAYLFWSGKMRCHPANRPDDSQPSDFRAFFHRFGHGCHSRHHPPSTGNSAFDEYRNETLRRLEEDQREFMEFLERLRKARDRAEFDQFMAERNHRPEETNSAPETS